MKPIKGIIRPSELSDFIRHKNWINFLMIVLIYSLSAFLLICSYQSDHWSVYVISFILMGAVQHTILTYVHEAAHGHLFSNKKLNDFLGQLLFSAPALSYLEDYRHFHLDHHRFTGKKDKDPELKMYEFMGIMDHYSSKKEVMRVFLNDFTGVSYFKGLIYLMKYVQEKRETGEIALPGVFAHATVIFWLIGMPFIMWKLGMLTAFLLVWVVPLVTITPLLLRWHGFGEHIRNKEGDLAQNTLTHRFGPLQTIFLYPLNSSFHLEHHLYPQIPWYSLKKFRRWANRNEDYRKAASVLEVDGMFLGKNSVLKTTFLFQRPQSGPGLSV